MIMPSKILYIKTVLSFEKNDQAAAVGRFVKALVGKGFYLEVLRGVTKL